MHYAKSVNEALAKADAAVLSTQWPDFKSIVADDVLRLMRGPVIVDPGGFLDGSLGHNPRIIYLTVGRAARNSA